MLRGHDCAKIHSNCDPQKITDLHITDFCFTLCCSGAVFVCVQVEGGGKADSLEQPLLVGDEIIIINDVELSGYRQEAVALVKGSYKTLKLTVRRYNQFCLFKCETPAQA